jgi:predicted chitinase
LRPAAPATASDNSQGSEATGFIDQARQGEAKMIRGLRPRKSKSKWYVSFQPKGLTKGTRTHTRLAETFQTEQEAKSFARAKLAEGLNVSAGTLNPQLPKRMISSAQMDDWLNEPDS